MSSRPASNAGGPYRIATVAELTGVPEPTLRAWERRYGVPSPQRTATRYRLYGAEDVELVQEMRRLCESGMAASEAARRVRARRQPAPEIETGSDPHATAVSLMLDAIDDFDDAALEHELRRALYLGSGVTVFDRVFAPLLVEVGDRWHAGELTVAQEHFITQKVATTLRDFLRLSPGSAGVRKAVFASFADDEHEIGLLGFALRVAELGVRPIFLGARTPPSAVRSAVERVEPMLVGLSLTVLPALARARELVDDYAAACGTTPWILGGGGAEAVADQVRARGGHVAPPSPEELTALAERFVRPELTRIR